MSLFAFDDPSGTMGRIAYDLGNVYQVPGVPRLHNSSVLFWLLQDAPQLHSPADAVPAASFEATVARIDAILSGLDAAPMARPDADLVKREFANGGRLLRHACRRGLQRIAGDDLAERKAELLADLEEAIAEHEALWLSRNRPGGLELSLKRFDRLLAAYRG